MDCLVSWNTVIGSVCSGRWSFSGLSCIVEHSNRFCVQVGGVSVDCLVSWSTVIGSVCSGRWSVSGLSCIVEHSNRFCVFRSVECQWTVLYRGAQ